MVARNTNAHAVQSAGTSELAGRSIYLKAASGSGEGQRD